MKAIFIIVYLTAYLLTCGDNLKTEISLDIFSDSLKITAVPAYYNFPLFYKKYIDAGGIPVISSEKVPDVALIKAHDIIVQMLSDVKIPDVVKKLNEYKVRIAVMSKSEITTDIPEHSDLNKAFPETNWNTRARGLSATIVRPATSCAEENLLCYANDPYRGECILVHEFAHTIYEMAIRYLLPDFVDRLNAIFENAKTKGLWVNTYAISNDSEYWAEGVQDFFNVNLQAIPSNGIHNEVNTREELKQYDNRLFNLISTCFEQDNKPISCYATN